MIMINKQKRQQTIINSHSFRIDEKNSAWLVSPRWTNSDENKQKTQQILCCQETLKHPSRSNINQDLATKLDFLLWFGAHSKKQTSHSDVSHLKRISVGSADLSQRDDNCKLTIVFHFFFHVFMCLHVYSCVFMCFIGQKSNWLMEEILHRLLFIKPYAKWDILHLNWCRIPSINRSISMYIYLEPKWAVFFVGKGLVLRGLPSKVEVIWVPGI